MYMSVHLNANVSVLQLSGSGSQLTHLDNLAFSVEASMSNPGVPMFCIFHQRFIGLVPILSDL